MNPPTKINHYPVVAARPVSDTEALVVCDRGLAIHDRYVTWRLYLGGDCRDRSAWLASAGHYTPSYEDAIANMESR